MRFWGVLLATLVAMVVVGGGAASAAGSGTDPDLEPGFPVKTFERAGTYHGGPAVLSLVANIDGDPTLEILVSALAAGPLYAWNADGSPQAGWPAPILGAAMPALGRLSASDPGLEVFSAHFGGALVAYNGAGVTLPGWPREASNYIASEPRPQGQKGRAIHSDCARRGRTPRGLTFSRAALRVVTNTNREGCTRSPRRTRRPTGAWEMRSRYATRTRPCPVCSGHLLIPAARPRRKR